MYKLFSFKDWLSEGGNTNLRNLSLDSAYERMCWVRACVYRIATSASTAPLKFYEGKPGALPSYNEKERIKDKNHPVYKLFNPPKPPTILSLKQLMQRTFIHVETDGLYFWLIERKSGTAATIDVRLKDELRAILEYRDNPTHPLLLGWEDVNGERYLPQDVLPISSYDPKNELAGLSPLKAARLSLESEYSIAGWNASFFKTGMKSPLLIQAKGQLTREQKKEIKSEITQYYSGIDGAHGALLMQGSVEIKPLTVNPKDIDFINGKKLNREEILAVFGVPPAMVGIFEYANYCVKSHTLVLCKSNQLKYIEDIQPGDIVLSLGEHSIVESKVLNCWEAGFKDVYTVKTKFRTIECSPDHKFLMRTTDGAVWIPAKNLKLEDELAIIVNPPETDGEYLPNGELATKELMHQLGLFVGDGDIDRNAKTGALRCVRIGRPETDPERESYIEEASLVFKPKRKFADGRGINIGKSATRYIIQSVSAAELVIDLGFAGTSKTKRIPQWVFGLKTSLKKALIQGILDTDGCWRNSGRYDLSFSNEELLNDVRNLCISVGYHVSNVRYSFKISNYGPNPMWHIYINTYDHGKHLRDGDLPHGLMWDKVQYISVAEEQAEMFDLEIEGTHNYFANWMVTHNSNVREQIRIFWEHTLLPKMNYVLELIQFNILDRDFPGVYAEWDLSNVVGLSPDPVEIANPAKVYMDMGYSPSQVSRILKCPSLEPAKDFKKPELTSAPTTPPKDPSKDPNAGDPKPSDKPKPDNNNTLALRDLVKKRVEFFARNAPLTANAPIVLKLWIDLVESLLQDHFQGRNLELYRTIPNLLCKKPTEEMQKELIERSEKIANLLVYGIYNAFSRV